MSNQVATSITGASVFTFQDAVEAIATGTPLEDAVSRVVGELSRSERLSLLDGDEEFWPGFRRLFYDRYGRLPYILGECARLGIPGIRFCDGPRGCVMGESTTFPVAMARTATWDPSLEHLVGSAIGLESKAQGANQFGGVCINLPRHPAWGRSQETFGEDPILLGEFGVAMTQGVQEHMMACIKHFALNSMENARFKVDVEVDEDVLHEVYLPHFRRVVEAGAASIMTAYNSVNGEWAGESMQLLTDILRGTWGFDGFTVTDFIWGLRDAAKSVEAGQDIEAPFMQQRYRHLEKALESGTASWASVDKICTRLLRKQLQFHNTLTSNQPDMSVVYSDEHRALSRRVAARSAVILKNEAVQGKPLLPIEPTKTHKIALVGHLADIPNTGDRGSSHVWSPHVVTAYEAIKVAFPKAHIELNDATSLESAEAAARGADLVICVVGFTAKDEGEYAAPTLLQDPGLRATHPPAVTEEDRVAAAFLEKSAPKDDDGDAWKAGAGGDRVSLRLREHDVEVIKTIARANPRTVVSVVCGGTVIMEEWKDCVPAIVMSWYAGCEGGHALMDVLLDRVPVGGRLPFSIPKDETHLPFFDKDATKIKYDRWYGQALLDKLGVQASYPLGFGLSYTTFSISNMVLDSLEKVAETESFVVRALVRNTGQRAGIHVAQIYACPNLADFPARILLGFQSVEVQAGQTKNVEVRASVRPLQKWVGGHFVLRTNAVQVELASYSGDPSALRRRVVLGKPSGERAKL